MELEGFTSVGKILQAGIYALVYRGSVVYIGKSKRMIVRIYTHRNNWGRKMRGGLADQPWAQIKGILFDDVHVLPCQLSDIDMLEAEMIAIYRPKFNIQLKPAQTKPLRSLTIGNHTVTIGDSPKPKPFERRV